MTKNSKPSMDGYYAAMNWLFENRPHMMKYIASLGAPKNDRRCDRAMVVAGPNLAPRLYANDEFLQEIGPAQAAGVLVHEWRHVLLNHFSETLNPKPNWRYSKVLADSQEVVINDNIELNGYELPEDCVRGDNRGGHFYGYWTTDEAYGPMEEWYLSQQSMNEDNDKNQEDESEDGESGSDGESSDGDGSSDSSNSTSEPGSSEGSSGSGSDSSSQSSSESEGNTSNNDSQGSDSKQSSNNTDSNTSGNADDNASNGTEENSGQSEDDSSTPSEAGNDDSEDTSDDSVLPEDSSLNNCNHGTFIEDENGELREMTDEELQSFIDRLNNIVADAVTDNPMPKDEKPTDSELDEMDQKVAEAIDSTRNGTYSKAGNSAGAAEKVLSGGKLQLGWLKLLQTINPEVGKADGGINAKASYNWARPRRTTSLIKGVNLPSAGAPRDRGIGAKKKPVALIALDFSGSIDRRLALALKDMAQSIPEEHIEARCFTFSIEAIPFDFKSKQNKVASGGTNFSCIEREALKIQAETGDYPYIICLTDGEAWFDDYYFSQNRGHKAEPNQKTLDERWIWVDVLNENDKRAFTGNQVYPQVKRQKNLNALPYDRSKL